MQGNHLRFMMRARVSLRGRWAVGAVAPVLISQPLSARLPLYSERRRFQFSECRLRRRHSHDIRKSRPHPAGFL